jgi:flagellar hook-associated protein 1 FlgK
MSLDVALRNAVTGVSVTQRHIEIVSRNVSNLDTPGYTRKIHQQEQRDPRIGGARSTDAVRIIEDALQRDLWRQTGRVQNFLVKEQVLQRVESASANPEDEYALASQFGRIRESFEALASSPDSLPDQQAVVDRARTFAESVNRLAGIYVAERDRTQAEIAASVDRVNAELRNIAALNEQIVNATLNGRRVPDLEDIRDESIRKVAEEMDIQVLRRTDGSVGVFSPGGRTLVDKTAFELSFTPVGIGPQTFYPAGVPGIILNGADITGEIRSGKIGANVELRDTILPRFQFQLDEFATRTAAAFEAAGLRLFAESDTANFTDALPDTTTGVADLTDNAGANSRQRIGYAGRMIVNPYVANDPRRVQTGYATSPPAVEAATPVLPPADPTRITAVLNQVFDSSAIAFAQTLAVENPAGTAVTTLTTGLTSLGSLDVYAREIVAYQTGERGQVSASLAGETTFRDTLSNRISDRSGVNLDQEVTLLIQLQQTYGANARVISATQTMFDQLLNAVR